jgi:hypothetical protein
VLAVVLLFYIVGLAVVAMILSLFTSVQGATTTYVARRCPAILGS